MRGSCVSKLHCHRVSQISLFYAGLKYKTTWPSSLPSFNDFLFWFTSGKRQGYTCTKLSRRGARLQYLYFQSFSKLISFVPFPSVSNLLFPSSPSSTFTYLRYRVSWLVLARGLLHFSLTLWSCMQRWNPIRNSFLQQFKISPTCLR